jgi:AdoMet-dependent heme synthase
MNKIRSPISVQYEITEGCNLSCAHCYNSFRFDGQTSSDAQLRPEIIEEIIRGEVFHVVITGGEPLVIPDQVLQSIRALKRANVMTNINSNLTLLTPEIARELKESGLNRVLTSIISYDVKKHDFQTGKEGSHQGTIRGMEIASNAGLPVSANMVVTKDTVEEVYTTGKFAANLGVRSFNATRVAPSKDRRSIDLLLGREEAESMLSQLNRLKDEFGMNVATLNPIPYCFSDNSIIYQGLIARGCSAGSGSATISPNGSLRACQHGGNGEGENILEVGLEEAWRIAPVYKRENLPEVCEPCDENVRCGGGCRESAYVVGGERKSQDPLCRGPAKAIHVHQERTIEGDEVSFYEGITTREEEDGGILFRNPGSLAILPKTEYELCLALASLGSFKVSELEARLGIESGDARPLLNQLYTQNLLREV